MCVLTEKDLFKKLNYLDIVFFNNSHFLNFVYLNDQERIERNKMVRCGLRKIYA